MLNLDDDFCKTGESVDLYALQVKKYVDDLYDLLLININEIFVDKMKTCFKNIDLLFALSFAMLFGIKRPQLVHEFCTAEFSFLLEHTRMCRVPSKDTFAELKEKIDSQKLSMYLEQWSASIFDYPIGRLTRKMASSPNVKRDHLGSVVHTPQKVNDITFELYEMLKTDVRDPRKPQGKIYKVYADLLIVVIFSAFSGITTAKGISDYCYTHLDFFKKFTTLKSAPSHDTFNLVLTDTDDAELTNCLSNWMEKNFEPPKIKAFREMEHYMVDGKACRATAAKSDGEAPRYVINAMSYGDAHGLAVIDISEKGNEQSRMKEILPKDKKGNTIFTADSAATVRDTIFEIIGRKWHYLLPLKMNQRILYEYTWNNTVNLRCSMGIQEKKCRTMEDDELSNITEINGTPCCVIRKKAHGRKDIYVCCVIQGEALSAYNKWVSELKDKSFYETVKSIAVVYKSSVGTGKAHQNDVPTTQARFYISTVEDIKPSEVIMLRSQHWSIEMGHYKLDVFLDEDMQTGHIGNFMANGAVLRRFVLAMKERCVRMRNASTQSFLIFNQRPENIAKTLKMAIG